MRSPCVALDRSARLDGVRSAGAPVRTTARRRVALALRVVSFDSFPPPAEPQPHGQTVPPPPPPDLIASGGTATSAATDSGQPAIGPGPAAATWFLGWFVANLVSGVLVLSAVGTEGAADTASMSSGLIIATLAVQWAAFLGAVVLASRKFGSGNIFVDLGLSARPIDLVGLPMGAITQLLLVPLAYVPLRYAWPGTFSPDALEQRSRDLFDNKSTVGIAALTVLIVVGAPLVEEIVYRGLLQRSFARALGRVGAWLAVSMWFAIVHLSPIEIPGLFIAGAVFGLGAMMTKRIGFGIAAHVGFNATAMVLMLVTG